MVPYAEHLCKNDRFEDALKVYKSINRPDLSQNMLRIMTHNSTHEARFKDAAQFYWQSAIENLSYVKDAQKPSDEDRHFLDLFQKQQQVSEMYHAYEIIHDFMENPFQQGDA
jgi:intraflagellar transport protein 122